MENLEDLFYETTRTINLRTNIKNSEQEEILSENIKKIERKLIYELENFRMPSRIFERIEDNFYELKSNLSRMNAGQSVRMSEDAICEIRGTLSGMEELREEKDEEEKNFVINSKFNRIQNNTEDRGKGNNQNKDYMYIEDSIKESYNDIQRMIGAYIQEYRNGELNRNIEDIIQILRQSCRSCVENMSERHEIHINEVTRMIQEQIEGLQTNVKDRMGKEQEKTEDSEEKEENSFNKYVKLFRADLDKFNEGAEKVVRDSQIKSTDEIETLPNDVIR